uniref:G-protein coupled receptors family 1 profile domain-containing protein n=1 Tax=Ditylenchus dipsaci TaxID=166011 RepID=A0A915DYS8_9BILA
MLECAHLFKLASNEEAEEAQEELVKESQKENEEYFSTDDDMLTFDRKCYERVNKSFTEGMDLLVGYHTVNILLGVICATIAAFNFYIFASTARFRQNYKILLALATADLVNTIAMTAMGANRRDVYNSVLKLADSNQEFMGLCN